MTPHFRRLPGVRVWIPGKAPLAMAAVVVALLPFVLRKCVSGPGILVHLLTQVCLNPFLASSLTAAALVFLLDRECTRRDMAVALGSTAPIAATYWLAGIGAAFWVGAPVLLGGAVLGMAAILASAFQGRGRLLLRVAALPVSMSVASLFLKTSIKLSPWTLDPMLYRFDQTLGGQASFWMGRLFARSEIVRNTCFLAYILLPVAAAVALIVERRRNSARKADPGILLPFLSLGVAGSLLYHLVPATGPAIAFHGLYPIRAPQVSELTGATELLRSGARNAMPSLHVSWALLLLWNARSWPRRIRAAFAVFFILTVMATLGLGEHYVIDLVVAFPFTLAVRAGFARKPAALLAGALATFAWLIALRSGVLINHAHAPLNWCLIAVTVAGSCALELRFRTASGFLVMPGRNSRARGVSFHDGSGSRVFRSRPQDVVEAAVNGRSTPVFNHFRFGSGVALAMDTRTTECCDTLQNRRTVA